MAANGITVAVTGSAGYIGTAVVKLLLEKGYQVRAAVRNPDDDTKVKHLKELNGANEKLSLFAADNLVAGSYDECFTGATYVLHIASPFFFGTQNPQKDLIEPAVQGSINALDSAAKAKAKRVVLTSSMISVCGDQAEKDPTHIWTEKDWNESVTIESNAYGLSKVTAERKAWERAKELDLDMVVINPSFVLGPVYSTRLDSTSVTTVQSAVKGAFKDGAPPRLFGSVDVRDVAEAHVLGFEKKEASGRYCITNIQQDDIFTVCQNIETAFPGEFELPKVRLDENKIPKEVSSDHSKAEKELGIKFHNIGDTMKDMVDSFRTYGLI